MVPPSRFHDPVAPLGASVWPAFSGPREVDGAGRVGEVAQGGESEVAAQVQRAAGQGQCPFLRPGPEELQRGTRPHRDVRLVGHAVEEPVTRYRRAG